MNIEPIGPIETILIDRKRLELWLVAEKGKLLAQVVAPDGSIWAEGVVLERLRPRSSRTIAERRARRVLRRARFALAQLELFPVLR